MEPIAETPTEPVDYALLSAAYGALLAALAYAARTTDTEPMAPHELLPLGAATFALSRTVSHEKVEEWVRRPFLDESERRPKGRRMRYAVGELLACTRCLGTWSALGLVSLRVGRPDAGRAVISVLGAKAINDFLQTGYSYLCAASNVEQRAADGDAA